MTKYEHAYIHMYILYTCTCTGVLELGQTATGNEPKLVPQK